MAKSAQPGFGEQAQAAAFAGAPAQAATAMVSRRLLKLGPDGRVLIPADLRRAMRLRDGDTLVATLSEEGELRLWGTDVGLDKMRKLVSPYLPEGSVVDEFLKERKAMLGEE